MLKLLLKKQLLEIFRSYYYDAKKNKARSKAATIAYIAMFAVLMVVVLGGIFTLLSVKRCAPMAQAGMGWLYFALMGLLAVFLGVFGSVFNTYASLYLAKDNDLLLSMPIPVCVLLASRLLGVYLMGLPVLRNCNSSGGDRLLGGGRCDAGKRAGRRAADCADLRFCHDAVLRAGVGGREDQPAEA